MIVAKIQVSGAIARTLYKKVIPAGIIGAQVEFEYAEDIWQGLSKTVVFRGPVTKDVVTDANIVTIPQEVTEKPMSLLSVGVYGVDADGNLAIPTIWADLGLVRDAANPSGDTTTDPALPVWAQIQAMIGNLDDLDTTAKNNLVAAVNEAMTKGGGSVDEAEIQRIVEEYLTANPPTVEETDPTVPAWAKQPEKPAYTAAEVGALSADTLPAAINTALAQAKDSGAFDGAPGENGYSPTASVAQTDTGAVITITDKTGTTTATLKNGADGQPGATGQTPNIQIGTVETLEAGSQATASMGGTPENPLLNLGIPQGASGSGGSGIAVTGATVGQTVKIAAVDDNGVPTAWEPVDLPSGGEAITAPVDLIASGTIPAGQAAWTHIGDIGVTWGDLKQYKSIGILWNNGTDGATLFLKALNKDQSLQLSAESTRCYTIMEFADTAKSKIQFKISALADFWIVDPGSVVNTTKWYTGGNAVFNPAIVTITYDDTDSITLFLNKATTVESTWYIFGLKK